MDKNFNIIKQKILNINCEDIRLFNENDKIIFSCNYFNELTNIFNVMICEFDNNYNIKKIIKPIKNFKMIKDTKESIPIYIKSIVSSFKTIFMGEKMNIMTKYFDKWEKNWILVNYNDSLHIIYKWYPLHICKISNDKLELVEIKNMPEIFAFCRGSTNGFKYDNMIWFIVHKTSTYKSYYHMLVIFDNDMNLKGYIEDFKFENCIVEFCLGLIVDNDNIIISYSTYDSNCKIIIYDKKIIESLINWL